MLRTLSDKLVLEGTVSRAFCTILVGSCFFFFFTELEVLCRWLGGEDSIRQISPRNGSFSDGDLSIQV